MVDVGSQIYIQIRCLGSKTIKEEDKGLALKSLIKQQTHAFISTPFILGTRQTNANDRRPVVI